MKQDVSRIMRAALRDISPYEPGKPVEEVRRQYGLADIVKMASNENPGGPSPLAVKAAAEELGRINFYPDGGGYYLKKKLSGFLGVREEQLILGNGSDDIIRMVVEAFLNEGEEAVVSDPSFVIYPAAVKLMGGIPRVAGMKDFRYDPEAIIGLFSEKTKLVFFANPNNPTGTILTRPEADRILERLPENAIAVFDEAYFEYVTSDDFPDSISRVKNGLPVICLRTFSKIYGLAGLRIGYGIAPEEIIECMNRIRQPFNVNSVAQKAAEAALGDEEHIRNSRELNEEGKEYLCSELEKRGVEYVGSEANFMLIRAGGEAAEKFLEMGVIVRGMGCYGLNDYIRVTVGLAGENERFIKCLDRI